MAVITLSWQYGCLGDLVAEDVAHQLGYRIIDKKEINDMLIHTVGQRSEELKTGKFLKTAEEEIEPGFFHRLHREHAAYMNMLISLIYQAASQDKVVIKGYGAQILLTQQFHVFCVRLKGSFDTRVSRIQQHHGLDRRSAEEMVKKEDRERMEFIQYIFKREVSNIEWYDMILDIKKVRLKTISALIVSAARAMEENHPITEAERKSLNTLGLEHRIKAIIQEKIPKIQQFEVAVSPGGIVTISGRGVSTDEKLFIEQRLRVLPEVRDVVNNMKVTSPLRRGK